MKGKDKLTENPKLRIGLKIPFRKHPYDGIRLRGIAKLKFDSARERLDHHMTEVKLLMTLLQIECPISDMKRAGSHDLSKTKTLKIKVANDHYGRLKLVSARKFSNHQKRIYMS